MFNRAVYYTTLTCILVLEEILFFFFFFCQVLTGKLNRANGMLSKIRHYVPKTELKSIYHAIFASHLRYGCQIWGLENTKKVEKIGKLQDKALRIINFAEFRAPVDPLYFSNELLILSDMVGLSNCLPY